ncbi:MAG: flagellin [Gluconacetobacter liquefaciens]|uniref:Flagellin n=1 Tax=Gluconacetobacter liquefaciens TaxID=89584 RepID=A0A370GAP2_GLULI|nr:flagellin [Gluconacetobacter liquefaciens]MBB2185747.1 flagellin [Gluconacetobacter liquefaciens]RDI39554.1 flagellin [Gluconacetobacter liquefaciens]
MSLSINNNASSKVAIETLNAVQSDLSNTQNVVSTGLKVSTAADNAAAFGIAQQMQGNVSGQSAVNDGLSFAAQTVSSTASAANQIISVLQQVQNAVTSLGNSYGVDASESQIGTQINGYLAQIDTIARNATFNGVNLLAPEASNAAAATKLGISTSDLSYVAGLQGDVTTVSGFTGSKISSYLTSSGGTAGATASATLTDLLGLSTGGTAGTNPTANVFVTSEGKFGSSYSGVASVADMIKQVQAAIKAMTYITSDLGSNTNVIKSMSTYGSTISDNLSNGIGALTDADMAAASAKLTSLQTKQQLAIKSLTIANSQSQNILSMFQ